MSGNRFLGVLIPNLEEFLDHIPLGASTGGRVRGVKVILLPSQYYHVGSRCKYLGTKIFFLGE